MKKISVLVLVVVMVIMIMSCKAQQPAQGATVEELQAQIKVLNDQIAAMQAKLAALEPYIILISPNGGDNLVIGEEYSIVWTSSGIKKVNIELENWKNVGGGGPLTCMIAENVSASPGDYLWTIPEDLEPTINPGDFYKIRIVDSSDASPYSQQIADSSNNYFSLTAK